MAIMKPSFVKLNNMHYQAVADPEKFGGGDLKHKTSKIRMSSPKLRVIFRPKSEKFKRFFRPNSGGLQKKKKKKGLHQNCFSPD